MVILGAFDSNEYSKSNERAEHLKERIDREFLSLNNAKLIHCYRVNFKGEIQIHCLYNDGTLYVHDKNDKYIITIMLMCRKRLKKYLKFAEGDLNDYHMTYKCAKVHELIDKCDLSKLKSKKENLFRRFNHEKI